MISLDPELGLKLGTFEFVVNRSAIWAIMFRSNSDRNQLQDILKTYLFVNLQSSNFMTRAASRKTKFVTCFNGLRGTRSVVFGKTKVIVTSKVDAVDLAILYHSKSPEIVV